MLSVAIFSPIDYGGVFPTSDVYSDHGSLESGGVHSPNNTYSTSLIAPSPLASLGHHHGRHGEPGAAASDRLSPHREEFAAEQLSLDRQSSSLVVIEQDSLLAVFLAQNLIFGSEIRDHILLLPIHPARENEKVQLPRLKNELHEWASWVE